MKKLWVVGFAVSILISFFFLILYFLSSTDIYHDYVSKQVLVSRNISVDALPEWTTGVGLWSFLRLDFAIRVIFQVFVTIVLVKLIRTGGKMKWIYFGAFIFSMVSFVSMFFYFLASTDIYHDYVSKNALISKTTDVASLPNWTNCTGEWGILTIDMYIRFVFMILITVVLVKWIKNYDKQPLAEPNL